MTSADISRLVETVAEGLRVWVRRGEVALTEDQIYERSRNVVDAIRGAFMVVPLPAEGRRGATVAELRELCAQGKPDPTWPMRRESGDLPKVAELRELYAQGKPDGHGHSCACRDCRAFNQTRRAQ